MLLEVIIFVFNIFDENWIPYLDDGNLGSTGVLYVEYNSIWFSDRDYIQIWVCVYIFI